jgi:hypothetical protein
MWWQLAPFGRPVAVREAAALVPGDQGDGLGAGGDAFGAVLGQDRAAAVNEHGGEVGFFGQPQCFGVADQLAEAAFGVAGPVAQLLGAQSDDHGGRCAGLGEFGAAQGELGQFGECVVHPLPVGPGVGQSAGGR